MPTWLLAELVPGMKGFSGEHFTGRLKIVSSPQQHGGSLSGKIEGIDLQRWIGTDKPHQLQGTAWLRLENLQWRGRSIEIARGDLQASAGKVSHSLLTVLAKKHYFVLGPQLSKGKIPDDGMLDFDELACHFRISNAGIEISGQCETRKSVPAGCLLSKDGQSLLLEPPYRVLQIARLVQVLTAMRPEVSWLPATREALEIANRLPLPETKSSPASSSANPGEKALR